MKIERHFLLSNKSIENTEVLWNDDGAHLTVISDPPYEADELPLETFDEIRDGHMLLFCKPENQFFEADEYIFWNKTPSTKNYSKHVGRFIEMVLVRRNYEAPFNTLHWSQMIGIYNDKLIDRDRKHPHQKPISLLERLIRIYTDPGDVVIDPYMGSGSMGVAAARLGRNYFGCEIDDERYRVASERVSDAFENQFKIQK